MVECYKNSLPHWRQTGLLLSVLFGSLSTKGTWCTTEDSSLACGRAKRAECTVVSVFFHGRSSASSSPHPFTVQTSALRFIIEKRSTFKLNPQTCKILVMSFGIWVSLYKSSMQIPRSKILFVFSRCFLPLTFFQVYLLEYSIYTKISLTIPCVDWCYMLHN